MGNRPLACLPVKEKRAKSPNLCFENRLIQLETTGIKILNKQAGFFFYITKLKIFFKPLDKSQMLRERCCPSPTSGPSRAESRKRTECSPTVRLLQRPPQSS